MIPYCRQPSLLFFYDPVFFEHGGSDGWITGPAQEKLLAEEGEMA